MIVVVPSYSMRCLYCLGFSVFLLRTFLLPILPLSIHLLRLGKITNIFTQSLTNIIVYVAPKTRKLVVEIVYYVT